MCSLNLNCLEQTLKVFVVSNPLVVIFLDDFIKFDDSIPKCLHIRLFHQLSYSTFASLQHFLPTWLSGTLTPQPYIVYHTLLEKKHRFPVDFSSTNSLIKLHEIISHLCPHYDPHQNPWNPHELAMKSHEINRNCLFCHVFTHEIHHFFAAEHLDPQRFSPVARGRRRTAAASPWTPG